MASASDNQDTAFGAPNSSSPELPSRLKQRLEEEQKRFGHGDRTAEDVKRDVEAHAERRDELMALKTDAAHMEISRAKEIEHQHEHQHASEHAKST